MYACENSELEEWNEERICREIEKIRQWQTEHGVTVFIGEFGVARETPGAAEYLRAVAAASLSHHISCIVYSFRETTWDTMNYELGPQLGATIVNTRLPWNDNPLMKTLLDISHISNAELKL